LKLQVRSSPSKPRAKEPAKKNTKKQRTEYPSTNVSSPIRAPKQKIQSFAYHGDDQEDDAFDAPRHPTRKAKPRGYEDDGFVVDDGFAPVREARSTKGGKVKVLGRPITTDDRVAELDDEQHCHVIDFMHGARKLRNEIMSEKGHREPIFNDTTLREMALELPLNLDEMRAIPEIKSEMVDRYGRRFLPLIRNTKELYQGNMPQRRHLPSLRRKGHGATKTRDSEDKVLDPNHQNIIDLCSETELAAVAEESESNYFDSDDDEDDDGEPHISHHFTQRLDPEVAAFNDRMTQLGPAVPKTTARASGGRGGSKVPSKKGKFSRRAGSGSFGKTYPGVKKRAPKATSSRASGGAGASKKPSGRGGGPTGGGSVANPWTSIMPMPT
jgi:bloom syndrome protein